MNKSYKYRIYPTVEQKQKIDQTIGACRFVYNLALETKIEAYKSGFKYLSFFDLCKQLTDLRNGCEWLKQSNVTALRSAIYSLDFAFQMFYNKVNKFPKFKSRKNKQSFSLSFNRRRINWENSTLTIPKIKDIPIILSRKFDGKIKTVTISKTPTGKYFASILADNGKELPTKQPIKNAIGIDLGIKHFLTTDNGIKIDNPKYLKEKLQRLKIIQHRASRKKKGSNNRKKANLKVALLHEKIKNQRLDYIHKVTSKLVRENQTDTFVMEDLDVKGMQSNPLLSQQISDVGWGEFKRQMKYKCYWKGKNLIVINRLYPSSKTCSSCGHIKQDLTLADRTYHCTNCGSVIDRDVNAAINIKNFGLNSGKGIPAEPVESPTLVGALKQEFKLN